MENVKYLQDIVKIIIKKTLNILFFKINSFTEIIPFLLKKNGNK
jgi:hypothetical protein